MVVCLRLDIVGLSLFWVTVLACGLSPLAKRWATRKVSELHLQILVRGMLVTSQRHVVYGHWRYVAAVKRRSNVRTGQPEVQE